MNEAPRVERAGHQVERRVERGRGFSRFELFVGLRQVPVFGERLRELEADQRLLFDGPVRARGGQTFFESLDRLGVLPAREQDAPEDSLSPRIDGFAVT